MNFSNNLVDVADLPTVDDVVFKPLEKKYLQVSRISFFLFFLLIVAIGILSFYFIKRLHSPVVIYPAIAVFSLLLIIGWVSDSISFKNSGYALRDKDLLFRKGWFIRKVRAVPLKRVQHVSVQSGPIERRFGLASLSIFTAGSEGADFTIKGISTETAQQIKEWISTQLNEELN